MSNKLGKQIINTILMSNFHLLLATISFLVTFLLNNGNKSANGKVLMASTNTNTFLNFC